MAALVTLPNGVNYSWPNQKVIIFGQPLIGITKLTLMEDQVKENNYGMGSEPTSRGYGNKSYTGSMEVYFDELVKIVSQSPGRTINDIGMFNFTVAMLSTRNVPYTIKVMGAEFTSFGLTSNQGDTKFLVELPLIIGGIKW